MAGLPERVFYSLSDIQTAWQISSSDIRQWLMHGQIRANVWLPLMSVYEIKEQAEGNRIILTKELRHWEGYTPLYPHHCRTLFRSGKVYLRDFLCPANNSKLALPETAESMRFCLDDLVILNVDRRDFEKLYHISETSVCNVKIIGRVGKPKYENNIIKAIGRGHQYLEMLEAEPDLTIMKLAEREMLDHGYIAKTIRMTQLAPDIIEAILNGRQPYSLSLTDFMKPFPNGWEEQRQHFRF